MKIYSERGTCRGKSQRGMRSKRSCLRNEEEGQEAWKGGPSISASIRQEKKKKKEEKLISIPMRGGGRFHT